MAGPPGRAPYRRAGARPTRSRTEPWSAVLAEHPDPDAAGAPAPDDAAAAAPDAAAPARRPRTRLLLALAAAVVVLDVVTKILVVAHLRPGENIRLLGGAVYLTLWRNTGAAFSFAEGATVLFSLIAAAVAVVIVRTARRLFSTGWAVALGLVLGGSLGNLIDRVFRAPGLLRGGVVDFISVFAPDGQFFPVFNAADSAIVCGGILGALLALRGIEFDGSGGRGSGRGSRAASGAGADDGGAARG